MPSFIHVDQPLSHAAVERADAVINYLRDVAKQFDGARGLAALLLSAVVSALVVVANRVVVNLAGGGLLLGWILLWGLAFVALALWANTARSLALRVTTSWRPRALESRQTGVPQTGSATAKVTNGPPACEWDQWRPMRDV